MSAAACFERSSLVSTWGSATALVVQCALMALLRGYTFDVERNRPELVCLFFGSQISCVTPGSCCQHTSDPLRFPIHRGMTGASDGWARANKARLRFDRFWTKACGSC